MAILAKNFEKNDFQLMQNWVCILGFTVVDYTDLVWIASATRCRFLVKGRVSLGGFLDRSLNTEIQKRGIIFSEPRLLSNKRELPLWNSKESYETFEAGNNDCRRSRKATLPWNVWSVPQAEPRFPQDYALGLAMITEYCTNCLQNCSNM